LHGRFGGVLGDLGAARVADGAADAGEEHPEVVVDLGGGGDRRARVAGRGALPQGDRGADAVEEIDLGLLHALQELPGVGGEALDVAALALSVEGVEGEAALPRAGDSRHHHQAVGGDGEIDVLEVVDANAPGEDGFSHGIRWRSRGFHRENTTANSTMPSLESSLLAT